MSDVDGDDRLHPGLSQHVADPVTGMQRHFPLRGQAPGQHDHPVEIAHNFDLRFRLGAIVT